MNTVTISVEEYNKLRDASVALQELMDGAKGFCRGWYPIAGSEKYFYTLNETEVIKELMAENQHLQSECSKYIKKIHENTREWVESKDKRIRGKVDVILPKKKRKWWQIFALLPLLFLFSCSPTAPVRVIEVEATWQPQQGSAPMTMDVQLTINKPLTGYGNVSWQYEYEELVPPYRKGTAVRLHQYTATNGVINVINTMDIVNPATIRVCGFKLLSVTVNTDDVMIVKNKNYVPCGKY